MGQIMEIIKFINRRQNIGAYSLQIGIPFNVIVNCPHSTADRWSRLAYLRGTLLPVTTRDMRTLQAAPTCADFSTCRVRGFPESESECEAEHAHSAGFHQ